MRIGYARVSSRSQSLLIQEARLAADGCDRVFSDTISGAAADRPEWHRLLATISEGDVLVATKLDRIARSLRHLLEVTEALTERQVDLVILDQPEVDTTSSIGRLVFRILAAVAEFERDLILERTQEGRDDAMASGVRFGRKPLMTPQMIEVARNGRRLGLSPASIGKTLGVSRLTVVRALEKDDEG